MEEFKIKDGILVKYNGAGGEVVVPDGVIAIGERAFEENEKITSLTLPDGVTSVGKLAFSGCSGLKTIVLPDASLIFSMYGFTTSIV